MNSEAQAILSDLKANREIRGPVLHAAEYWRTYLLMAVYGAFLLVWVLSYKENVDARIVGCIVYMLSAIIVTTAITDGQRAINRRFDRLVEQLEKKGVL